MMRYNDITMETQNVPHEFEVDEMVHYNVGSDCYPARVVRVSPSGKSVWIECVHWCKDTTKTRLVDFGRGLTIDDVIVTGYSGPAVKFTLTTRKRGGTRWRCGNCHLYHGFYAYQDPHF